MAGTKLATFLRQSLRCAIGVRYKHGHVALAVNASNETENVTKNVHTVADALRFTSGAAQNTTVVRVRILKF